MYMKSVRKWWFLKRNRIICPEWPIFAWKIESFCEITWKNRYFSKNFPGRNRILCVKSTEKNRNFWKVAWKTEICLTQIHDPRFQTKLTPLRRSIEIEHLTIIIVFLPLLLNCCAFSLSYSCSFWSGEDGIFAVYILFIHQRLLYPILPAITCLILPAATIRLIDVKTIDPKNKNAFL